MRRKSPTMSTRCFTWKDAPELATDYVRLIHQFGANEGLQAWANNYVSWHAGRALWDVEFLTNNYRFTNCLNIGGAPFIFEYLLMKARHELSVVSLDLDSSRFPLVERVLGLKIEAIDVEIPELTAVAKLGQFECVVLCEVFEHLRLNIPRTISFIKDLLSKDGILYLTTPNGVGLAAWQRLLHGRTGPDPVSEWAKLSEIGHMGHVREYSYVEIRDLLQNYGFEIVEHVYRRREHHWGTTRSKLRDRAISLLTMSIPSLADEMVLVARKRG